ncbi:MAG TPA: hypothetical protein VF657_01325 [Actinoplanes sp.]|jgi:hypothetical protein
MTSFRARTHPLAASVSRTLHEHPLVDTFHERFGVDREAARTILTESVLDAMDLLGSAYVTRMTQVVGRMTQLRQAIHLVYEKVLAGSGTTVDPQVLRRTFEQLHEATRELADPLTWAEKDGAQVEALPVRPDLLYPGARPGLADKPSHAPRHGDPRPGQPGRQWEVRTKRTGDITLEMDLEGLYWKFPELEEGVILHFPDHGYRVWKDPVTHAVVEELLVGASMTGSRKLTRGEDVIFSAADMGDAYRKGGTQRAHGAGSPGLGFDAGYGVAHAIERINQWLENKGVEQWVRDLRDNAEPGVEYVWTTRTGKRGQKLADREYTISAIADGALHELYTFAAAVPDGPPDRNAAIEFEVVRVTPTVARYGNPVLRKGAGAGKTAGENKLPERLDVPDVVAEALGRTKRSAPEAGHPAAARTGERLKRLTSLLEGELYPQAALAKDTAVTAAIDELSHVVAHLDTEIRTSAPDPQRLARIDAAVSAVTGRGKKATLAHLKALIDALADLERER